MIIPFPGRGANAPLRPKAKLRDLLRDYMRSHHYSLRTEETYWGWIKQFILFHGKRHPSEMGALEIKAFLTHLALSRNVAARTQNQAFNALVFLYKRILQVQPGQLQNIPRANGPIRLPTVLTQEEVRRLLGALNGESRLICSLLYGAGLRVMEGLRLRVKDLDFEKNTVMVRGGKGDKDRVTMLSARLIPEIERHLERVKMIHNADLARGLGRTILPNSLDAKYPSLGRSWNWQFVFPSRSVSTDPRTGAEARHHVHETLIQKHLKAAARLAGINKHVGVITS